MKAVYYPYDHVFHSRVTNRIIGDIVRFRLFEYMLPRHQARRQRRLIKQPSH